MPNIDGGSGDGGGFHTPKEEVKNFNDQKS